MNIFSSKNELSNNYLHPIEIDGKTWKNVSQYIYSNFLSEENNKKILKHNLKNMSQKFDELVNSEEEKLTIEGLQTALPVKFANIELARKLISTGDYNIVYSSSNMVLGINSEGKGKNIYGKLLMEVRKNLKRQSNIRFTKTVENEKKEIIYRAYLVKYFIEDILYNNEDFTPYTSMTVEQIYDMVNGDYNSDGPFRANIYNSFQAYKQSLDKLSKDTVLGFVDPEIKTYPKRVVEFVLKKKLRNAQITAIEKRKNIIYEMYLDHFLSKNNLDHKVKNLFNSYDKVIQNRENFLKFLEVAYSKEKLPSDLQSQISELIKNIYIPSDNEIEKAESAVFDLNVKPETKDETKTETKEPETKEPKPSGKVSSFIDSIFEPFGGQGPKRPSEQKCDNKTSLKSEDIRAILDAVMQGEEIPTALLQKQPETQNLVLNPNNQNDIYFELCPIAYDMLKIDTNIGTIKKIDIKMERWFPSVSHYLIFLMIKKLMDNTTQAYDVLLKSKTDNKFEFHTIDVINNRYKDLMFQKYQYYLERAIDIKFKDNDMIDALLQTGEIELLYKDNHDEILGTGKHKKGGNFTGKYLMELREKMMAKNPTLKVKTVISPVEQFLMNEDEWVESRVKDYCNIIQNLGKDIEPQILIETLKKIFPANFPHSDKIPPQPRYFNNMINSEIPSLNTNLKSHIWESLVDMGNYLINMSSNPNKVLKNCSLIVQSNAFVENKNYHTIIKNVIVNLGEFVRNMEINQQIPNVSSINNNHIEIATNIILKRSYSSIRDIDFDLSSEEEEDGNGSDAGDSDDSQRSIRTASSGSQRSGSVSSDREYDSDSPKRRTPSDSREYTEEKLEKLFQEVINYDLPEEIKRGRVHYFYEITKPSEEY